MTYKKYDSEMLNEINQNVDLLNYVVKDFDLEKRGDLYYIHCPLHIDKTASLCIFPETNSFYCFSCKRSGKIISWLYEIEGYTFQEAVNRAAILAKIDLTKMCRSDTIAFLRQYTKSRKKDKPDFEHEILNSDIMTKFRSEYPVEWLEEGITTESMDAFEIKVDDFSNRIVYPVYDTSGNLINVKGRTRYEEYKELGIPKYINYYKVGGLDYFQCLSVTMPFIKQANEIIIFESIKSVMKCWGWGIKNCVSAETHTLTDQQINLLIKLRVNIVFAFDSDVNYWSTSIRKMIDKLKRLTNVFVIVDRENLLGGKDAKNSPADCGESVWRELYENRKKMV